MDNIKEINFPDNYANFLAIFVDETKANKLDKINKVLGKEVKVKEIRYNLLSKMINFSRTSLTILL